MKKKTIIGLILSSLILVAGLGTYIHNELYSKHFEENVEDDKLQVHLEKGHGMTIKKVNSSTNSDGSITKTFSYTIHPDDATDKSVSIGFYTTNEYTNSNYFTFSSNTYKQTISVTCKQAFDKKLNVHVRSNYDSDIYATIAIDYEKKITGVGGGIYDGVYICYGKDYDDMADYYDDVITYDDLYSIDYSKYSKDKNYTFRLEVDDWELSECNLTNYPYDKTSLDEKYANLVINAVENQTTITDLQIRSCYQSTAYYQWLSNYFTNGGYIYFDLYLSLYCNETNECLTSDYYFTIGINFEGRTFTS